jgi:D-3-phosphoglycerate dehydrogenase
MATFHLGRQAAGNDVIAIMGVDPVVPDPLRQRLREVPHIRHVKVLRF